MAAIATITSGTRIASRIAWACSANARAATLPSASRVPANIGTKPALKAPSANSRRRKLGSLKATKKASASGRSAAWSTGLASEPGSAATERGLLGYRRFARLRRGLLGAQRRGEAPLDLPQLLPLVDLQPEHVLDVEDVDHAL